MLCLNYKLYFHHINPKLILLIKNYLKIHTFIFNLSSSSDIFFSKLQFAEVVNVNLSFSSANKSV